MLTHNPWRGRFLGRRAGEVYGLGAQTVGNGGTGRTASRRRSTHRSRFSPTPVSRARQHIHRFRPYGCGRSGPGGRVDVHTRCACLGRTFCNPFCGIAERRAAKNNRRWRATHATLSAAPRPPARPKRRRIRRRVPCEERTPAIRINLVAPPATCPITDPTGRFAPRPAPISVRDAGDWGTMTKWLLPGRTTNPARSAERAGRSVMPFTPRSPEPPEASGRRHTPMGPVSRAWAN